MSAPIEKNDLPNLFMNFPLPIDQAPKPVYDITYAGIEVTSSGFEMPQ